MKPRTAHIALGALGACAIAAALWTLHLHTQRRALLMADPDALPQSPALFAAARSSGEGAFARHCAACHGAHGQGDSTRGAPSLTDRDWLYGTGHIGEIEWTITHGIRAPDPRSWNLAVMPAYATPTPSAIAGIAPLDPGEIRDVVEYVLSAGHRPHEISAAARGDAVFHGPGGCFDCHGMDARGDSAIGAPDLTDGIWLTGDGSPAALFATIARGRRGMCPSWGTSLDPATIRALAVYVFWLSHPSSRS